MSMTDDIGSGSASATSTSQSSGGALGGPGGNGAGKGDDLHAVKGSSGDSEGAGLSDSANLGVIALIALLLGVIGYFITRKLGANQDDARAEYRDQVRSRMTKTSGSTG
jgi:hypothetical protein